MLLLNHNNIVSGLNLYYFRNNSVLGFVGIYTFFSVINWYVDWFIVGGML